MENPAEVCLEMTGMGASLEVEQPSMRRKKSRVQTHGTLGHSAHQIYFLFRHQRRKLKSRQRSS